jgi:protein-L-isoaspartate O-methyltransferase
MAWRSGGSTNAEMCEQLRRNQIITKPEVLDAFLKVERGFFVPESVQRHAYDDSPLRADGVHMSAPHIYGSIMDALDVKEGNSFLNVGSGTGYISTIAAVLGGVTSLNHGIEVDPKVHKFASERTSEFRNYYKKQFGNNIAEIRLCCGNVFDLEEFSGHDLPAAFPVMRTPVMATPVHGNNHTWMSPMTASSSSSSTCSSSTSSSTPSLDGVNVASTHSVDMMEQDDSAITCLQFGNSHLNHNGGHSINNNGHHETAGIRSRSSSSLSSTSTNQQRSRSSSLASAYDMDVVYDRIYVGAACNETLKQKLLSCLSLGGILVAPIEDEVRLTLSVSIIYFIPMFLSLSVYIF